MPNWTLKSANIVAALITAAGCTQMIGYLAGSRELRGIGLATVAAPLPKVFSDVEGLETFASDFTLRGIDSAGEPFALAITPELYARLEGCYNRRNVYGAALSYAPRMPEALWTAVFCYGLKPGGPLRHEFGLPEGARGLSVEIRTKTRGRNESWVLSPACAQ
ncbi:MAG TPA: hypothetical protein VL069_15770 [Opitutus sp.]|nr:hypothetical protein [Opitutus sp.]